MAPVQSGDKNVPSASDWRKERANDIWAVPALMRGCHRRLRKLKARVARIARVGQGPSRLLCFAASLSLPLDPHTLLVMCSKLSQSHRRITSPGARHLLRAKPRFDPGWMGHGPPWMTLRLHGVAGGRSTVDGRSWGRYCTSSIERFAYAIPGLFLSTPALASTPPSPILPPLQAP
ncbi:uncharacterized protein CIMG_05856 [Coccidioides immitis RS]|uniref:Uncharacterized protein n=1 Tax=Coccidioides immitis (strain RS) TaxID=246410 RepID=A0A0E1RVN9_COCIM|nr:uncharacterized protein CIMG_05856 [Coccidioides immitis RS]EAS30377.2 hypothetical protein CIMG_05856 [Coccidioides immitis RS]